MILLVDCDGVLTDGTLNIDHTGTKVFKSFHTRDVRALREFVARGWEVSIVTQDGSEIIRQFAGKVGVDLIVVRNKSEVKPSQPYYMVGDDAPDVDLLKHANLAFCPKDADLSVQALPNVRILNTFGGRGVIAELAQIVFA